MLEHLPRDSRLALQLVDGDQRAILDHLRRDTVDMALIYDWEVEPSIVKERLIGLRPYALFSAADPLAKREQVSLAELVDRPMVLLDAPPSEAYFKSLFQARGLEPTIAYRTRALEMLRGLVGSGLGYAILVTPIASTMAYGGQRLTAVSLSDVEDIRYVTLAFRAGRTFGPDWELFRKTCRGVLGEGTVVG